MNWINFIIEIIIAVHIIIVSLFIILATMINPRKILMKDIL